MAWTWKSEGRAIVAEFLVTFLFIFTICANGLNEARTHVTTAAVSAGISTGFAATALIFAFGGLSGAHFNPAVTLGAMIGLKINWIMGLVYMFVQLVAAIGAVGLLMYLFPGDGTAAALVLKPGDGVSWGQAGLMEVVLTFILVFVIWCTAMGPKTAITESDVEAQEDLVQKVADNKAKSNFAAIAIGFTLGFLCFLGGTISGGCFNPARATAPAVLANDYTWLGLYWVADCLGAAIAAGLYIVCFKL